MDGKSMILAAAIGVALAGGLQAQDGRLLRNEVYFSEAAEPDCVAVSYPAIAERLSAAAASGREACRRTCGDCGCDHCSDCCDGGACCCWRTDSYGRRYKDADCKKRLLGIFAPTDTRFLDFVSPITNPVYFEDPRTLTEARVIFMNNQIPGNVLGGGDVQLLATQLRAALTKRLSIIAVKDGYIFAGSDAPPINGWANVNVGLKYNLYANARTQRLLSAGARYEMPVGSHHALQGTGGGQFDLFLTGGTQIGGYSHFVSAAGFRLPTDRSSQNQQFWWSAHVDRRMRKRPIYGLLECNWYHWMSSGTGGVPGVGGLDLYNLGSSAVAGTNIVTAAIGVRYKPTALMETGIAWQAPISARHDIIDNRITADLILRY